METHAALAEAVNARMQELGASQERIADQSGIAVDTINEIQQGIPQRYPEATLAALSKALGLPERHFSRIARGQQPPTPAEIEADRRLTEANRRIAGLEAGLQELSERVNRLESNQPWRP